MANHALRCEGGRAILRMNLYLVAECPACRYPMT